MPLIHDHAQQPPGGHDFIDPSGVRLHAERLSDLLTKIAAYRRANGLAAGDPAKEVEADYIVRYPWLVTKVGTTVAAKEDPIARWINRQWRLPVKERDFAESTVTAGRLARCAECEYYSPDHPYDAEARRRLTILGFGRVTDEAACSVHHWAVGLAALHQNPESPHRPEGCWIGGIMP